MGKIKWAKRAQKGLKMGSKRHQNYPKMMPKWSPGDPGLTQKWSKISKKNHPNIGAILVPKLSKNGPIYPR